ncbi:hypothetical protein ATANTOWER_032077 [Ataeniobius toweri]|uniref:Uncharacterized protein n=1 Tax=Ataeniobius toweri TaxID=208326 RepID=A0ABU7BLV3_9TELE|nr:hypothetical protein [Ataeniobius toweri]
MSLCWQTDINSSTGSKEAIRSSIICKDKPVKQIVPEKFPTETRGLYEAERSGLPVWKEDNRDPITVQWRWRTTSRSSSTAGG